MARKRVTIQQLANACGLSRNTVSKVFNDRGSVPEATRQLVMQKAREFGYYQFFDESGQKAEPSQLRNIALVTRRVPVPEDAHFATFFLPAFMERLSKAGYMLTMHEVTPGEMKSLSLPSHMALEQMAGITVIELFDPKYLDMLCSLGIPCISVDTFAAAHLSPLKCDLISMENIASTVAVTERIIASGAIHLGFIGDPDHCNSFYQRWEGFCTALSRAGLPLNRSLCILEPDSTNYGSEEWLFNRIKAMPVRPDAIICANDFLALHLMKVLKKMGLSIPSDIMIAGFDGIPQANVVEPSLTTVQIPNAVIGQIAADTLLDRIENPDSPFRTTYVQTTPVWRHSTAR